MSLEQATAYRDLPVQKVSRDGVHEQVVDPMQELDFRAAPKVGEAIAT